MNKKRLVKATIAGIVTGTACYISYCNGYFLGRNRAFEEAKVYCEKALACCKEAYDNYYPDITNASIDLEHGGSFKWNSNGVDYCRF